jgi:hypothetical protein
MKLWQRRELLVGLVLGSLVLIAGPVASASSFQSKSTNYGVNEVFMGSGGSLQECSTTYCAKVALGETAVGHATSASYQMNAGFNTTDFPSLEFFVASSTVDLGVLNSGLVHSGSTTFSVLDYVSSGYTVILTGSPPSDGGSSPHTLNAMTSAGAETTGTEQFGINLAVNTTPVVGQNPQQVPNSTFGFGAASTGYNTTNQFKFNPGDIVASSSTASGETLYTMSVIANISNSTPGGAYTGTMGLVVVATF